MEWFKILLLVIFGLEVFTQLFKSSGWRPETKDWGHALSAVFNALLLVGIWLWL